MDGYALRKGSEPVEMEDPCYKLAGSLISRIGKMPRDGGGEGAGWRNYSELFWREKLMT